MEVQLVIATWGLVIVTGLLVVVASIEYRARKAQESAAAKRDLDTMQVLAAQAAAMSENADASRKMAAELLESRKLAAPLAVDVSLGSASAPGIAFLVIGPATPDVVARIVTVSAQQRGEELLSDIDEHGTLVAASRTYAVRLDYDSGSRWIIEVEIVGQRLGGPMMSVTVPFNIMDNGRLERIDTVSPPFEWA